MKGGLAAGVALIAPERVLAEFDPGPASAAGHAPEPVAGSRQRLRLDRGWRFALGNLDDPARDFGFGAYQRFSVFAKQGNADGPAEARFDDSAWKSVTLPHDWAVELPFINARDTPELGAKALGREYPETSIGWYRLEFTLPAEDQGKRISLEFDGIFRNATVFLNGFYLAQNLSGYIPLAVDVTDYVEAATGSVRDRIARDRASAEAALAKVDRANHPATRRAEAAKAAADAAVAGRNVLVVRVDASAHEGWFYEGAGIYRHAWLVKTPPIHVERWGQTVRSNVRSIASPEKGSADISVITEIAHEGSAAARIAARTLLLDQHGNRAGVALSPEQQVAPGERISLTALHTLLGAQLWSPASPALYRAETTLIVNGEAGDTVSTTFGIRKVVFDPQRGMLLNELPLKLLGTCNHQDHAGVGAAVPDAVQDYRISLLREMGSNALRTSHNAPTPELLDACDRQGMMVMDEARTMASTPEGLAELELQIRRDRNHPCVVIWSLGNEEPMQGTPRGERVVGTMQALQRRLDPTRVSTVAMNGSWGQGISDIIAVQGFNYATPKITPWRQRFPNMPAVGTETGSTVTTRGIYANDKARGYVDSYGQHPPSWAERPEDWWPFYDEHPWLAGGFIWTGFDYRGEPTPYGWPCISSHFGLLDTCGFPKDISFYYRAWWRPEPLLHLFPHWNAPPAQPNGLVRVVAYTNQQSVELFVNGTSAGVKSVPRNGYPTWDVPYAPGMIEARATSDGKVTLSRQRRTTGEPVALVTTVHRSRLVADGQDAAIVNVAVVDSRGDVVPDASCPVTFTVTGGALVLGVGNGDPSSHEPDKASARTTFGGLAQAILQMPLAPGPIHVTASSPGLRSGELTLTAVAPSSPQPA
jgi:beta-galactosidase